MLPKTKIAMLGLLLMAILLASCSSNETQPIGPTETLIENQDKAVARSFDDWLAAQGTFCWGGDPDDCFLFNPPIPNYEIWYNPETYKAIQPDYAGIAGAWIYEETEGAVDLGTVVTGRVMETVRKDGSALVHVTLKAENALFWGLDWSMGMEGDPLFGYTPQLVAWEGMEAALGTVNMNIKFVMPEAGMPFPDLLVISFAPTEDQYLEFYSVNCKAEGHLREASGYPEGTWGKARVIQVTNTIPEPQNNPNWDGWPVEQVYIGQ